MNILKYIFKTKVPKQKLIKSIVCAGDVIEVEEFGDGTRQIYKVEQFEVITNGLYPPTNLVILVTLSYNNGVSSTQCTWGNIKYVRHISHAK